MSNKISWLLEVSILPGQLENFKSVAHDLIAVTKNEKTTLAYEWELSPDGTKCDIYERYADSEAMIAHVKSFHNYAERFMEACRVTSFHVYGTPNDAAKALLAALQPAYFTHLGGFHR
jgi:quinol monooxygenase YgiN